MSNRFKLPHSKFNELTVSKHGDVTIVSDIWTITITSKSDMITFFHKHHGRFYQEYFEWSSKDKTFKLIKK